MSARYWNIIIGLAFVLLTILPVSVAAVERTVPATVSVNPMISITIFDNGNAGINFGTLTPGVISQPEESQFQQGAFTVLAGVENNTLIVLSMRADDFTSNGDVMPAEVIKWNTDNDVENAKMMSNTYTQIQTMDAGVDLSIWNWISISSDQVPGSYNTKLYIKNEQKNQ